MPKHGGRLKLFLAKLCLCYLPNLAQGICTYRLLSQDRHDLGKPCNCISNPAVCFIYLLEGVPASQAIINQENSTGAYH